jgi:K+-sensing histidine kinase KdpD
MRLLQLVPSPGKEPRLGEELQRRGVHAEVTHASSPEEFVQSLETGAFDAVVVNEALLRTTSALGSTRTPGRLARQHAAMSLLIAVVQELSHAREMQQIVEIVHRAAQQLTGADSAAFVLREGEYARYVAESAAEPIWSGRRFPLRNCVSGWAITERRSIAIADVYRESRVPIEHYRATFVQSLAAVPIRSAEPLGAIAVHWADRHECTADELMLLEALANTTAVAIENVRVYASLERLVEERTRELQAANEELEAFTSAASHDLRAPLRAMSAAIEVLDAVGDKPAPVQKELLRAQVVRMNDLIDDLLRLSRIGRTQLKRESCDLREISESVLQRLQLMHPERRVEQRFTGDLRAYADPGLIAIALDNLLSNSWKYSANQPVARIELGVHVNAAGERVFTVCDNGAGFDENQAHRLFKPFQRLHSEQEFAGTGLGLATVQRIISRHGGAVWAQARAEGGACLSFTLDERDGAKPLP